VLQLLVYITEWNVAGTANCEVSSGQTYQVDINITSAGPCDAGNLLSPLTQNIYPGSIFSIIPDNSVVSDGGFELGIENINTGGTGGTGAGIRLIVQFLLQEQVHTLSLIFLLVMLHLEHQ
jgi:hypothetical protein